MEIKKWEKRGGVKRGNFRRSNRLSVYQGSEKWELPRAVNIEEGICKDIEEWISNGRGERDATELRRYGRRVLAEESDFESNPRTVGDANGVSGEICFSKFRVRDFWSVECEYVHSNECGNIIQTYLSSPQRNGGAVKAKEKARKIYARE